MELNGFLLDVVDLMEREAGIGDVRFDLRLWEGLPPISSDPSRLQQVFLTIFGNALGACEGKTFGTVTVKWNLRNWA